MTKWCKVRRVENKLALTSVDECGRVCGGPKAPRVLCADTDGLAGAPVKRQTSAAGTHQIAIPALWRGACVPCTWQSVFVL